MTISFPSFSRKNEIFCLLFVATSRNLFVVQATLNLVASASVVNVVQVGFES